MSLWVPWASKIDTAGNQADVAKNDENHRFSMVVEVWRVISEARRSSGMGVWHSGWQKAG